MNSAQLRGMEMLADQITRTKALLTYKDKTGQHTVEVDYTPLTGTVQVGRIACSTQELPRWMAAFYKAEFISIETKKPNQE